MCAVNAYWYSWKNTSARRIFFTEYAYFSSFSDTWLEHARSYGDDVQRLGLDQNSSVVELAMAMATCSNISSTRKIPVLGIEPAQCG